MGRIAGSEAWLIASSMAWLRLRVIPRSFISRQRTCPAPLVCWSILIFFLEVHDGSRDLKSLGRWHAVKVLPYFRTRSFQHRQNACFVRSWTCSVMRLLAGQTFTVTPSGEVVFFLCFCFSNKSAAPIHVQICTTGFVSPLRSASTLEWQRCSRRILIHETGSDVMLYKTESGPHAITKQNTVRVFLRIMWLTM